MPTTLNESQKIISIAQEYLPLEKLAELFNRLHKEVGQNSENDSVKESLRMMSALLMGEK